MTRLHVLPVGDVTVHAVQATCWCHPTEGEPGQWIHNAKDCREAKERVTGNRCSEGWVVFAEEVRSELRPIEPEQVQLIIGALDSLAVALTDHGHEWTEGERAIYEDALKSLGVERAKEEEPE